MKKLIVLLLLFSSFLLAQDDYSGSYFTKKYWRLSGTTLSPISSTWSLSGITNIGLSGNLVPTVTNTSVFGSADYIWNTGYLGTLTLGDDSDNVNGQLNLVSAGNAQGKIAINDSDQITFNGAGGGYVFDGTIRGGNAALDADATNVLGNSSYIGMGDPSSVAVMGLIGWNANTSGTNLNFLKTRSNTLTDANTILLDGDDVMSISGLGADGAAYRALARIRYSVDGTPGSSDMPGRISFWTTPDGSATPAERARINNAGELMINSTTDAGNYKLQVNGSAYVGSGSLVLAGNISANAWTTNGIGIVRQAGTFTDLTSSGTVANAYTNVLGGNTIAASNSTTFTNYYTTYINAPVAGTNVTITNPYALGVGGNTLQTGNLSVQSSLITDERVVTLADSASISIATGTAGFGRVMIGDNQEEAEIKWKADGTVTLIRNSTNVASDNSTDNTLNIYDGGSGIVIKNLLGSQLKLAISLKYYTP